VTLGGNMLVYLLFTRRLHRLTELGIIPDQKWDPKSAYGPSSANPAPRTR
jgi:hypothetical protein